MDIKDIEYFIAIYEQGGFTNASRHFNISQPALSQSLRKLESEFSLTLFDRNSKKLTEGGEFLYKKGKQILKELKSTSEYLYNMKSCHKELLRIGISPFYSKYYLPALLPQLNGISNLEYEIVEDISMNLEKKLIARKVDICFFPVFPANPMIEYKTLCIEEILVAIPKSYEVNQKAIPGKDLPYIKLEDLENLPFVSLKKVQKIMATIDEICRENGFVPNIVYETMDWDTVNIMITNGIGVGFVPDILLKKSQSEEDQPNFYRIANRSIRRDYAAAWLKDTTLPSYANEIINIFKESILQYHLE